MNTDGGWTIASGAANYKVCRYSSDYNATSPISNSEHPLWYRGVTGALDSQNFLVVAGNRNCPTDNPQNFGSPFNASDDTTVDHQPTAALSPTEPAATGTDLLMD